MNIKDMPFVTVEQVNLLREAAIKLEQENKLLIKANEGLCKIMHEPKRAFHFADIKDNNE